MQAGNLRKRILLQQRAATKDASFGQQTLGWMDVSTVWGDIQAISGAQLARSQSIYSMTSHHITVRFSQTFADMKRVGSYRIVYITNGTTRYFDIGGSLNDSERNRMITLLASEGLNDGQ
jgi:SPP1 family predicted phage head-tail adaptor